MTNLVTLFPHQDLKFHEVRYHIDNCEKDILLSMPMASGKTKTTQYLIEDLKSSRMFNTYIVIVPLVSIKESWLQSINIFSESNDLTFNYTAKTFNVSNVKNKDFWEIYTDETFIVSRKALASKEIIEWLKKEKPNCSKIFIVCDEGHHHADINVSGELCKILWELGATILRITGTPWHNETELISEKTKIVNLSFGEYARQKHPLTKEFLAPMKWESRKCLVQFNTDNLDYAYGPDTLEKIKLPDEFKIQCIESLKNQWIEDGCPKTIINVPRTDWAEDLIKTLKESKEIQLIINRIPNVQNFTGKVTLNRKNYLNEILKSEGNITDYNESKIDIIISCARMDEGTDWSLCSHVYNIRMPDSAIKILQRWGRAGRSKLKIKNYPSQWKDIQSITFFLPLLSDKIKDIFWKDHKNTALIMACFMENYELAQKWCYTNTALDRFSEKLTALRNVRSSRQIINNDFIDKSINDSIDNTNNKPIEKSTSESIRNIIDETVNENNENPNILEDATSLSEIIKIVCNEKDKSAKNIYTILCEKLGNKKDKLYKNTIGKLIDLIQRENPNIVKTTNDSKLKTERKQTFLIREELIDIFENIIDDIGDIEIKLPQNLNMMICSFTAYDAELIQSKMKETWDKIPKFSADLIRSEAENYKAQFGTYPTFKDGPWRGFGGLAWHGAHLWLKENNFGTLVKFLGLSNVKSQKETIAELLKFKFDNEGRWPLSKSTSKGEQFLYERMSYLRNKYPRIASELGLPEKSINSLEENISLIKNYYNEHGYYPFRTKKTSSINNDVKCTCENHIYYTSILSKRLAFLRKNHVQLLKENNIPLDDDNRCADPINLQLLVTEILINLIKNGNLFRKWKISKVCDVEWISVNNYFGHVKLKPQYSRSLYKQKEICQCSSVRKLISEIQNSCWMFKILNENKYAYYKEIKSENLVIDENVPARRTHYLDWNNSNIPDKKVFTN